ncbi:MAG: hypothetical protein ABIR91_04875 [Candidatus Saccharimonadales bacterium]
MYRTLRDMPYPDQSPEFFKLYDKIVALTSDISAAAPHETLARTQPTLMLEPNV